VWLVVMAASTRVAMASGGWGSEAPGRCALDTTDFTFSTHINVSPPGAEAER
jgi:hypothetical protein